MKKDPLSQVKKWTFEPFLQDVESVIRRNVKLPDVKHLAIMPDVHLAHNVCVGSVIATESLLYPQAIGADIGCGMLAIAFDCNADLIGKHAEKLMSLLRQAVPILRQPGLGDSAEYSDRLMVEELSSSVLQKKAERIGRISLGTLGRGNHFLEFQEDDNGQLWLMLHTGSRIMGQEITAFHLPK